MRRGVILYERADAEKNRVLIKKYSAALSKRGVAPSLILTDRLDEADVLSMAQGAELVINRTRNAALARYLEENGLFVTNPSAVTETANDKSLTYERLRALVPMLETHILTDEKPPLAFPFVAKPAAGHGGNGVSMIRSEADLTAYRAAHPERSVVQPLASTLGRDMRVYVVGRRPVCAMLRESDTDFRSNFSLGGRARMIPVEGLSAEERGIVSAVCGALPLDYAGVDIIYNDGHPILNEIEDPVGARMLYIYTETDPAEEHVKYILKESTI